MLTHPRFGEFDLSSLETVFYGASAISPARVASCGRPSPWVHLELQDSQGWPVADGEPGEILRARTLVMDGYRDEPELNAEAFRGGWLHTGDVPVRDVQVFLRIVDRKDMIVSGGFNIYPCEIEDNIAEHPAVALVAVFGLPDDKWGEAVTACVVLKAGATASADELVAAVAAIKCSYQAPKRVEFIDAIPQTTVGKPDKKALKARLTAATSPV